MTWMWRRRLRENRRFAKMNLAEREAYALKIAAEIVQEFDARALTAVPSLPFKLDEEDLGGLSREEQSAFLLRVSRALQSEPSPALNTTECAILVADEACFQFGEDGAPVDFRSLTDKEARQEISCALREFHKQTVGARDAASPIEISLNAARRTRQRIVKSPADGRSLQLFRLLPDEVQCQLISRMVGKPISLDYYRKTRRKIGKA